MTNMNNVVQEFETIYYKWLYEKDVFEKKKLKDEIVNNFSKTDALLYSINYSNSPFEVFRSIYPLTDLFDTIEQMKRQGMNVENITSQFISINTPEDLNAMDHALNKPVFPEKYNFHYMLSCNMASYSKQINELSAFFPKMYFDNVTMEQIEELGKTDINFRNVFVILSANNISEITLDKLDKLEKKYRIASIKIEESNNQLSHEENAMLPLKGYKLIKKNVDEIISKLYVEDNAEKMHIDYQLAIQIMNKLAEKIQFDYKTAEESLEIQKNKASSGLNGILMGRATSKGYSEILRNVLSCVGIECTKVTGRNDKGKPHTWNQVKLGEKWFNVDITNARTNLFIGNPSGDLFMSDAIFYGDRRKYTFDKGKFINGKKMETYVSIGGHKKITQNHFGKKCPVYIPPNLTYSMLERTKQYPSIYKRNHKLQKYEGVIPYVGSKTEKMRNEEMKMKQLTKNIEKNKEDK